METYNDWLAHHGIKGMKWDKRNGPPYPLSDAQRSSTENRLNPTSRSAKLLQLDRARGRKVSGTGSDVKKKEGLGYNKPVGETARPGSSSSVTSGRRRKTEGIGSDVNKKEGLGYNKQVGETTRPGSSSGVETSLNDADLNNLSREEIIDKLLEDNPKFIYENVVGLINKYGPYDEIDPKTVTKIKSELRDKYGSKIAGVLWFCYVTDEGED